MIRFGDGTSLPQAQETPAQPDVPSDEQHWP